MSQVYCIVLTCYFVFQEMFIFDSAGKELFADVVQKYVGILFIYL